ncbi:hypothetical protein J4N45_11195 [Vibrio sp. SCSIO 43140]|uniref:hypothetical protein n=1 Tax=Vibrio sp. SCSIO 43140 TaxID=2819100 RepID=UPI002074AF29|nr:hypothetical protein [Vibrio sp. SCSIO 43140]USD59097.1 hypothetical protein J4N45_11195 [Vibrio sp. SCSIO 43140]
MDDLSEGRRQTKAISVLCMAIAIVIGIAIAIAIFYGEVNDIVNHTRLDRYYEADVAGDTINCNELVQARQHEEGVRFLSEPIHSVGLLSYIYLKGVEFSQCRNEIDELKQAYCNSIDISDRQSALKMATSRYRDEHKYRTFCSLELERRLSLINDDIEISDSKVVHLPQEQVSIAANSIYKLSYKEVADSLWRLTIYVAPYENSQHQTHNMYFTSKASLNDARQQLSLLMR